MHRGYWLLLLLIAIITYYCRSFLPFIWFSHDGIEVEFSVPSTLEPHLSAKYIALKCDDLSFGSFNWRPQNRRYHVELKKIAEGRYQGVVPFYDHSPCKWRLNSFGVSFSYQNESVLTEHNVVGGRGGVMLFNLTRPPKRVRDWQLVQGNVMFNQELMSNYSNNNSKMLVKPPPMVDVYSRRAVDAAQHYKEPYSYAARYESDLNKYYYNSDVDLGYDEKGQRKRPKMTINVTLDESSLFADWSKSADSDTAIQTQ